jgi:hypothetical protein
MFKHPIPHALADVEHFLVVWVAKEIDVVAELLDNGLWEHLYLLSN